MPPSTRDDPVRVARIITRLNVGGPAVQAVNLSTRLEAAGCRTLLVHGRLGAGEGDMSYLIPPTGIDQQYLASLVRPIAPLNDLVTLRRLVRQFRRFKPDIVHTHTAKAGTLGRLAALIYNGTRPKHARARLVHTYHGHVFEGYFSSRTSRLFAGMERMLARQTDAIVAISNAVRTDLLSVHGIGRPEQYRVIPLGFDLSPFTAITNEDRTRARRELGLPTAAPVVSWIGRFTAIKQPHLMLDVASAVSRKCPAVRILMVGDGELRMEVEQEALTRGLENTMTFAGWRRDLPTIYAASDVVALTSRNEGTPVAIIEAMASGVPCVSTDVGGVADVIADPDVGILAPPGDAAAVAYGIESLLASPARRAMGEAARRRVQTRFSLDRLVSDILNLYDDLLGRTTR